MRRVSEASKPCAACGVPMLRKRYGAQLEDMTAFNKRKYCSLSCANSKQEVGRQGNLWRARKHRKSQCESCGERRSLHVHHIDQNQANNDPKNLQTLCKWCHNFLLAAAKRLGIEAPGRMASLGLQAESKNGWTDLGHSEMQLSPNKPIRSSRQSRKSRA